MLENVCAHESPGSGRGYRHIADRTRPKRNQVVSPYGRFTLVTIWSLVGQKPHLKARFWRKADIRQIAQVG
jgi:hypothetical protein